MRAPRLSMSIVVFVIGLILVACCAGWALVAQALVPDACDVADPPGNTGPLECGD